MTAPFAHPELIWPDLAARIERAHAVHARNGQTGQDPAAPDHAIEAALDDARAEGNPVLSRVPSIVNVSARDALDEAFLTAERLFGESGVPVPDSGDFALAGLNLTALGATWAASRGAGQGSDTLLTPVLAAHGLGAAWWRARFAALRADSAIEDNPLRATGNDSGDGDGLTLAPDVIAGFRVFDAVPEGARTGAVPVVLGSRASARDSSDRSIGEVEWTLRLIPSGPTPVHVNLNHRAGGAEHPTLPEMLALQAGRILQGEPPVDQGVFTWLAGTIGDGRIAARAMWDASIGVVRVSCREIGNQGSYLGVRPPVSA